MYVWMSCICKRAPTLSFGIWNEKSCRLSCIIHIINSRFVCVYVCICACVCLDLYTFAVVLWLLCTNIALVAPMAAAIARPRTCVSFWEANILIEISAYIQTNMNAHATQAQQFVMNAHAKRAAAALIHQAHTHTHIRTNTHEYTHEIPFIRYNCDAPPRRRLPCVLRSADLCANGHEHSRARANDVTTIRRNIAACARPGLTCASAQPNWNSLHWQCSWNRTRCDALAGGHYWRPVCRPDASAPLRGRLCEILMSWTNYFRENISAWGVATNSTA